MPGVSGEGGRWAQVQLRPQHGSGRGPRGAGKLCPPCFSSSSPAGPSRSPLVSGHSPKCSPSGAPHARHGSASKRPPPPPPCPPFSEVPHCCSNPSFEICCLCEGPPAQEAPLRTAYGENGRRPDEGRAGSVSRLPGGGGGAGAGEGETEPSSPRETPTSRPLLSLEGPALCRLRSDLLSISIGHRKSRPPASVPRSCCHCRHGLGGVTQCDAVCPQLTRSGGEEQVPPPALPPPSVWDAAPCQAPQPPGVPGPRSKDTTLTKPGEQTKVFSKFTVLCGAEVAAALGARAGGGDPEH